MRVQITRRGGLAGVPLHAELATSDLDDQTAAQVEGVLDRLMDQAPVASPPQPDRFYYEIILPDRNKSMSVAERDLPPELTPLVEMLSRVGSLGNSASAGRSESEP